MFDSLSRRRRRVLLTSVLLGLLVVGGAAALWTDGSPESYRPGQHVEGLTTTLSREAPEELPPIYFRDVSKAASIRFKHFGGRRSGQLPEDMGSGAAWIDYNRDGWADLFVANIAGPLTMSPEERAQSRAHCALYRNEGDGTFTEIGEEAGVADPEGRGLQATWADFTGDGRPDLYVANDVSDNVLYRNEGGGEFVEISRRARVADYRGAMGLAVGDWDHDRRLDLFVSHWIAQENAFYVSQGRPPETPYDESRTIQFMDQADRYGLGQVALDYVGWGTSFFDYDNDGNLDLFVVNGSTLQQEKTPHRLRPEPNLLFWNRGAAKGFYDASAIVRSGTVFRTRQGTPVSEQVSRGAAVADYDRDGDLDLFVVNHDGPARLYRNEGETDHHWLAVRLAGRASNRSALGARLVLHADSTTHLREVGTQGAGAQPSQRADSLAEADRFWTLYRKATDARTAGHYSQAIRFYRKALDRRPGHRDARFYLGDALFRAGRLKEAGQRWNALLADYPEGARVRGQLAGLRLCAKDAEMHDLNRAKRHFRAIVRIHSEETEPLVRFAQILIVRDSLDRARDALAPLSERGALPAEAAFLQGYLAWRAGDSRTATVNLARARRALSADTTDEAHFRVPSPHQNEVCRALSGWRSTLEDVPPGQIETTETYSRFRKEVKQVREAS